MAKADKQKLYEIENREWIESLEYIIKNEPKDRVQGLLNKLQQKAFSEGIEFRCPSTTPYMNTIPASEESPFPGSREIERRIKSIIRWNAMAMVVNANKEDTGIGGHISTYASAATLYEVGFNHFFHAKDEDGESDLVYFQGHASPGIYARSFLEGRFNEDHLKNFRHELRDKKGLSSYPHPRLMPEYWNFPTVSMGLGPIMAIYQARFNQYMVDNGLKKPSKRKVWAFLGDGEMDEPEAMGAITLAAREQLDNLIFVVNCNLQRLDGPVRGNGQIIQELEAAFKGAGWNVLKVVWGSDWDPLFEKDKDGILVDRLNEIVDGKSQKYSISGGDYIRKDLFGKDERLLKLVENYSDEQLTKLRRGGHDPVKVYNAYKRAVEHTGSPTIILARTIKGYGMGEAGEGRNVTHQQKKLNEDELREFRGRFGIPIADKDLAKAPFYKPDKETDEMKYLQKQREKLGGYLPYRDPGKSKSLDKPGEEIFKEYLKDSGDREVATTMVIVQILSNLLKDKKLGKFVVPIVPDESRTFGMDALFRQVGIYAHSGQLYEPVDRESLLYYKEAKDGAILEEGITEAGSMSSFIAAGTSGVTHGIPTIPFYIFYSMFGFQRVGDLIWAAADARAKGFLVGGTAGRTSLPGEGLQHADGNSHMLAFTVPTVKAYDPAYAYELAVIVEEGINKMFVKQEDIIYYITVMNEKYTMPALPENSREGILKGMYKVKDAEKETKLNLLGSGTILREAMKAADMLGEYDLEVNVWSVTSYKELYYDALKVERHNKFTEKDMKKSYIQQCVGDDEDQVFVAASDYLKAVPLTVQKWFPGKFTALGTDGFGLSENREKLRDYFEVDAKHIAFTALSEMVRKGTVKQETWKKAKKKWNINPDKDYPTLGE